MSYLSPSLRLENMPTEPTITFDHLTPEKRYNRNNIVAKWCAPINGKLYRIELEHGTTTGKRMVWVNGKVNINWLNWLVIDLIVLFDLIRNPVINFSFILTGSDTSRLDVPFGGWRFVLYRWSALYTAHWTSARFQIRLFALYWWQNTGRIHRGADQ